MPLPSGLGDPHRPILDVTALKPAPAAVPAGEEAHRDLAGATIRKDLEAIVGFSTADRARGEKAWGRITDLERAARFYAFFINEIAKTDRTALQTK